MFIIVSYDIKTDEIGNKILQKVFKICKKYLFRLQNSVFIGELSKMEIENLKKELSYCIRNSDKCDIMIVKNVKNIVHYSLSQQQDYNKTIII